MNIPHILRAYWSLTSILAMCQRGGYIRTLSLEICNKGFHATHPRRLNKSWDKWWLWNISPGFTRHDQLFYFGVGEKVFRIFGFVFYVHPSNNHHRDIRLEHVMFVISCKLKTSLLIKSLSTKQNDRNKGNSIIKLYKNNWQHLFKITRDTFWKLK